MKFKRVVALVLCLLMACCVSMPGVFAEDAELPFTDVARDGWAYNGIEFMYSKGYMAGVSPTLFAPGIGMTRSMFVTVLAAMSGVKPANDRDSSFFDVPAGKYYTGAVIWAAQNGIVAGTGNGAFSPDAQITREQAAVMIRGYGVYLDYDVTYQDDTLLRLCYDNASTRAYARDAVCWALDYGLMSNRGDMDFCPQGVLTRDEAALILGKFADYRELPPINPPTVRTVSFVNWDSGLLYTTLVADGTGAKYRGPLPTRPNDRYYKYTFSGWSVSFERVTSDLTVTAQYSYIPIPAWEIDIRNDIFGPGMSINNSTFRMSDSLFNRLNNSLYNSGGRTVGFYVVDLDSRMTLAYNAGRAFLPACTVKAGFALYAYKKIEAGGASFSDRWTYRERHYCDRSGTIQFSPYGTVYSAEYVLHNMIHISDNAAYYMAQDYLGYRGYNDYITSIGVKHTHWSYASWGSLTPQELGLIWQEIYRYRYESPTGAKLFDEFLNAKFNFIKEGLNYKYPVAHKSGWNDNSYNDAAIVFAERPYVMVIMTTPGDLDGNQAYLGRIARLLDEYMSEYTAWVKNNG